MAIFCFIRIPETATVIEYGITSDALPPGIERRYTADVPNQFNDRQFVESEPKRATMGGVGINGMEKF